MATIIYNCSQNNNKCPKKENCKRYINAANNEFCATLSKQACTESNNYMLYIKHEMKEEKESDVL